MPTAPFAEVVVAPMCFYCKEIDVAMIVHGDFFAEGRVEALLQVDENKLRISPMSLAGPRHEKDIKSLEREITYGTDGWTWTDNPAQSKKLVDELNLGGAKGAATPGSKAERYRSLAGRLLHHSSDDPRVQFDTGLVRRGMNTPRVLDESRLHRVASYIAGAPGVAWLFRWQGGGETLKLYGMADADHAGDVESRRSVSCSQEFLGGHLLDQDVGRQTCVAVSALRGSSTRSFDDGFGFPHVEGPTAYSDSVGKLKHLQVKRLWLEQARTDR